MSILQRGRRYVVSSVAFLFLASTGFTLAGPPKLAFADTVKQGSAMGFSGCIPGITQFGAELFVHLDATATWSNGSHRVTVNSADARLDIRDCGTIGGTVGDGVVNYQTTATFYGNGITNCSFGIPGGVSCTIDPNHAVATVTNAFPPAPNGAGSGQFDVSGMVADAGTVGVIDTVVVTTIAALTKGQSQAVAYTSVFLSK
jgi:hypothetical protein